MSSRSRKKAERPPSIFLSEEPPARPSRRKGRGDPSRMTGETSPSSIAGSSGSSTSEGSSSPSGRTSREYSQLAITPSAASSLPWSVLTAPSCQSEDGLAVAWLLDHYEAPPGEFWTPNTSDCPRDAKDSSLSRVLEEDPIPQKYYLSPRAAAGILRRSDKRKREIPSVLRNALVKVAARSPSLRKTMGQTRGS